MSEFTGTPGSVSPATPANGPTRRVPVAMRFSVAAEDVLRRYVRGYRRIHRTRVLYWDSCPWSPYPSRSRRNPVTGSTGAPRRRRDTAASLAIMAMEADTEHVELSTVTVSPSLSAGSGTTWTAITLIALDCLVRAIRYLRGPWARQVGTLTVVMSQPGTPAWTARPHLHDVIATGIAEQVTALWRDITTFFGIPTSSADVVVRPLDTRDASALSATAIYMGQDDDVLPPRETDDWWTLTAVARHGADLLLGGDNSGLDWLHAWSATQAAITASGVTPGLVTTRSLQAAARHLAAEINVPETAARSEMGAVVAAMLALRPSIWSSLEQLAPAQVIQRHRVAEALASLRDHGLRRAARPGPARRVAIAVACRALAHDQEELSSEWCAPDERKRVLPHQRWANDLHKVEVRPRARSPPSTARHQPHLRRETWG